MRTARRVIIVAVAAISLSVAAAASAAAFGRAGAVAPAWSAAQGMTTGVRPPDARAAGAARQAGSWGRAIEVPGLGALNKGGGAGVTSVSCASAGNCSVGGGYTDRRGHQQGFVAVERRGRWGQAIEVPGLGALNKGDAYISSVSCGSARNCAAGGGYRDRSRYDQGFVAVEKNGRWGQAIEVPGLAALNKGGNAAVTSVSCGSAGRCAAAGFYAAGTLLQGFVVSQRHRRWGPGDRGAGTGSPEQERGRRGLVGVVRLGGQLRGRRGLHRSS